MKYIYISSDLHPYFSILLQILSNNLLYRTRKKHKKLRHNNICTIVKGPICSKSTKYDIKNINTKPIIPAMFTLLFWNHFFILSYFPIKYPIIKKR